MELIAELLHYIMTVADLVLDVPFPFNKGALEFSAILLSPLCGCMFTCGPIVKTAPSPRMPAGFCESPITRHQIVLNICHLSGIANRQSEHWPIGPREFSTRNRL